MVESVPVTVRCHGADANLISSLRLRIFLSSLTVVSIHCMLSDEMKLFLKLISTLGQHAKTLIS